MHCFRVVVEAETLKTFKGCLDRLMNVKKMEGYGHCVGRRD